MADRPSQKALSEFISEAQETIEALDRDLLGLEETRHGQEADPDRLNAVFRAAHSLKGLAAMFGVERMTRLAHALEDRLDDVRMGRRPLDPPTLDLLLAAPALFGKIIAEEAAGGPPATAAAAEDLAARLRGAGPQAEAPAEDPLAALDLDPSVRAVLTEYEEHRLRANAQKPGVRLHRVRVAFELSTFDTGLEGLKSRLKGIGEVVSTLPSPDASDPNAIAFDVLFATREEAARVREVAGSGSQVIEVGRRAAAPSGAGTRPLPPIRPEPRDLPHALPLEPSDLPPATPPRSSLQRPPADATPAAAPRAAAAEAESSLRSVSQAVRVDIRKLDRLMNLVGELVLVKTSVLRVAERLRAGDDAATLGLELHRESRSLERKLNELQSGILEVRMVPLGQIFDKLSRMVRKLSRDLGKQVEFEVRGGEVELDKLIVEELSDPLMHLIRNAIDHAIEAPEVRTRAGKRAAGRITLSAEQKGSHVRISVADDGSGIDEARVREVAMTRGLVAPEALAQLARRELLGLIFLPGFSTAREVTAVSGRGVGMDVVKNNIAALSGVIDLHTDPGMGTRFEITLPVTLAIIRALVVAAGGRTYALPLNGVLEIVTVQPSEIRTVELKEVVSLRGATLPLVRLSRLFEAPAPGAAAPPHGPLFAVVVGLAHDRLALAVEAMIGQQDIVVKPLGKALAGVRGIAGATDLGNRRTVLVLDLAALIEEVARGEGLVEAAS
ncbi:MAG TPA: chemotaxis protein CheA [Anaeromyxobacteraceae bacterium]|nr:chemotaxis protein CheA [Anaeromyxobacteraceae bacterium]